MNNQNLNIFNAFVEMVKEKINQVLDNVIEDFKKNFGDQVSRNDNNFGSKKNIDSPVQKPKLSKLNTLSIDNQAQMIKDEIDQVIVKSFKKYYLEKSTIKCPTNYMNKPKENKKEPEVERPEFINPKSNIFDHKKTDNFNYNYFSTRRYKEKNANEFIKINPNFKNSEEIAQRIVSQNVKIDKNLPSTIVLQERSDYSFGDWHSLFISPNQILDQFFTHHSNFPKNCLKIEKLAAIFKENKNSISSNLVVKQKENDEVENKIIFEEKYQPDQSSNLTSKNEESFFETKTKSKSNHESTEETTLSDDDTITSYLGNFDSSQRKDLFLDFKLAEEHRDVIFEADLAYKKLEKAKDKFTKNVAYLIRERLNELINYITLNKREKATEIDDELRQILDFLKIDLKKFEHLPDHKDEKSRIISDTAKLLIEEIQSKYKKFDDQGRLISKPPPAPRNSLHKTKSSQEIEQNSPQTPSEQESFEEIEEKITKCEEKNLESVTTSIKNEYPDFSQPDYASHIYGTKRGTQQPGELPQRSQLIDHEESSDENITQGDQESQLQKKKTQLQKINFTQATPEENLFDECLESDWTSSDLSDPNLRDKNQILDEGDFLDELTDTFRSIVQQTDNESSKIVDRSESNEFHEQKDTLLRKNEKFS
ncbi:hypothetical protein BpHYR1_045972 [Brachionus plicatilis]|uniref:Uncharacterized protein n=1 Tax=Brachionus plicatilis TaxID=10195 RepID=A0A3M7T7A4_BRAPC|nr:hypothetical protein BpHYR1_045972 [Brachionus plicatilis]